MTNDFDWHTPDPKTGSNWRLINPKLPWEDQHTDGEIDSNMKELL
jgi:hypothetical protein